MNRGLSVILALGAALLAACSGGSPSATSASFAGRWTLRTVNGAALPYTSTQSATAKSELLGDVIGASSGGSFIDTMTVRTTQNGLVAVDTVPRSGIWVLDGSTVTFTFFDDGLSSTANFDGNSLTVSASGKSYVYSRR